MRSQSAQEPDAVVSYLFREPVQLRPEAILQAAVIYVRAVDIVVNNEDFARGWESRSGRH